MVSRSTFSWNICLLFNSTSSTVADGSTLCAEVTSRRSQRFLPFRGTCTLRPLDDRRYSPHGVYGVKCLFQVKRRRSRKQHSRGGSTNVRGHAEICNQVLTASNLPRNRVGIHRFRRLPVACWHATRERDETQLKGNCQTPSRLTRFQGCPTPNPRSRPFSSRSVQGTSRA